MDLDECFRKGVIKKTRVNLELVKSLTEMSNSKEQTIKLAKITEISVSAYVSLAYDSLREILDALCVLNGYKVLSHVCVGELLNAILENFNFKDFDKFRYIRNGINYYGTKLDLEQGKLLLLKIFAMRKNLKEKYLTEI